MKFIEKLLESLRGKNHSDIVAIAGIILVHLISRTIEARYDISVQAGSFNFHPARESTEQKPQEAEQNQPVQDKAQPAPEKPEQKAAAGQEEAEKKQSET